MSGHADADRRMRSHGPGSSCGRGLPRHFVWTGAERGIGVGAVGVRERVCSRTRAAVRFLSSFIQRTRAGFVMVRRPAGLARSARNFNQETCHEFFQNQFRARVHRERIHRGRAKRARSPPADRRAAFAKADARNAGGHPADAGTARAGNRRAESSSRRAAESARRFPEDGRCERAAASGWPGTIRSRDWSAFPHDGFVGGGGDSRECHAWRRGAALDCVPDGGPLRHDWRSGPDGDERSAVARRSDHDRGRWEQDVPQHLVRRSILGRELDGEKSGPAGSRRPRPAAARLQRAQPRTRARRRGRSVFRGLREHRFQAR